MPSDTSDILDKLWPLGRRMPPSPSPRPSPAWRGWTASHVVTNPGASVGQAGGRGFSFSRRERAGVRGKRGPTDLRASNMTGTIECCQSSGKYPLHPENSQTRSADFQSAVSQACSLHRLGLSGPTGAFDALLQYALEWGFFTRCQWGEFDTALYELERCWGRKPESPSPIGAGGRPAPDRTIRSLADVHAAVEHYVKSIPYGRVLATATHLSTDIDYRIVSDKEMERALTRRAQAEAAERDLYASYVQEAFLTALEKHGGEIVYQFSFGAEPLPFETGSRLTQRAIAQLAEMVSRHPKLRFQCFLASRHANQSLCTLARELPNFSLAGYWWHNFFPTVIRQIIGERLDMVPANKQVGFFSDAYCVEWTYAKAILVRKQMAQVLAQRIEQGQYTREEALAIARAILFETPQSLLGMTPRHPRS
ncbi:MAG: hypothetical protein HY735_00255 [Verrucomicrobia bacterium]|nr:hypothetical protein [Verrucomicrobiota bacterium]